MLLDNDGGGIFDFLPVTRAGEEYVQHVATPHGLDFAHAAALFGLGYEVAASVDDFRAALAARWTPIAPASSPPAQTAPHNVALHGAVWDAVAAGDLASRFAISMADLGITPSAGRRWPAPRDGRRCRAAIAPAPSSVVNGWPVSLIVVPSMIFADLIAR